jgi:hypothetical protein
MFNIEKNVKNNSIERMSWPWKDMDIGDSVLFEEKSLARRAQNNCHVYARNSGKKYMTRKEGDGIRVWRVA